jgi:hypothetical protein
MLLASADHPVSLGSLPREPEQESSMTLRDLRAIQAAGSSMRSMVSRRQWASSF